MQEQHHLAQEPCEPHQGKHRAPCSIPSSWERSLQTALDARRAQGLWRERVVNHSGSRSQVIVSQNEVSATQIQLNFAANDYLGLSQHPQIVAAWQEGAKRYGVGSGASGLVSGYTEAHANLEQQLAEWQGYERALLFVSGFSANQAIIHALCAAGDLILADKLTHASLLEAAMLSPATLR
ncbi:MAG: aminotransferase class I/II-fold pyridoxal phosphate-dependent enzyme, partial [Plesiomonas shigelloides]